MCAIFGWFKPDLTPAQREILFRQLARKAQVWGRKSFGAAARVAGVGAKSKSKVTMQTVRYTGAASEWLAQNKKEIKQWAASDVLLGHTRMPTHGDVCKRNTHPFVIGDWIAAHNGVISNSSELMVKSAYAASGETDSEEALCWAVDQGFTPEALDKIKGYFAFEALKRDGSELILAVDDRARLHTVRVGDGIVWCTDGDALESSLRAAGVRATPEKLTSKILRLPGWTTEDVLPRIAYSLDYQTQQSLGTSGVGSVGSVGSDGGYGGYGSWCGSEGTAAAARLAAEKRHRKSRWDRRGKYEKFKGYTEASDADNTSGNASGNASGNWWDGARYQPRETQETGPEQPEYDGHTKALPFWRDGDGEFID